MIRPTAITLTIIKSAKLKNGKHKLFFQYYAEGKRSYFSTGVELNFKDWNAAKTKVKLTSPDYLMLNTKIKMWKSRIDEILTEEPYVAFDDFKIRLNVKKKVTTLMYYFTLAIKNLEKNGKHRQSTIGNYSKVLHKCQKAWPADISIAAFHQKEMDTYYRYCISIGNQPNTINRNIKTIKTILRLAESDGVKVDSNALRYKLTNTRTTRIFLSTDEVDSLYEFYTDTKVDRYKRTLKMFLIGCYTGLRYGDIVTLTLDNVEDGTITKRMNKSGILKTVKIPVVSRAKELLSEYPFIEKVSNQKCNVYLKEIAVLLGIKKHVVFHSSRHTFATLALNQGIPVEVVSEVLGHSDIRTTQVYAKIVETTVMEQMQKFK